MPDIWEDLKHFVNDEDPDEIEYVEDGWKGDWIYFQQGHTINVGRPTSELQKQIARDNAIKRNENYKGEGNPNAKTWKITFNDGRVIVIKALQRWAVDNGYSRAGVKNLAYGKWKRYRDISEIKLVTSKLP